MHCRASVSMALLAAVVVPIAAEAPASAYVAHTQAGVGRDGHMGKLLSSTPLARDLWPAGTAQAYRVTYLSSDHVGKPTVMSGSVFIPAASYRGPDAQAGRPVVSWAHETVGIAPRCAPSLVGQPEESSSVISALLGKGYLVVASDYEGLGMSEPHPFLVGESEAHAVTDIVRAAGQLDGTDASRTWMVAGHSQGGQAALFTGSIASQYARDLDFRGTFASAPISQWRATLEQAKPFEPQAPGNPFVPLVLSGLDSVEPGLFDESSILTPAGMKEYQQARTTICYSELAATMRAGKGVDFYHFDPADLGKLQDALERHDEVPIRQYTRPVFIGQGTADTTVYPIASQMTATKLSQAGTGTTFKWYPGIGHGPVQEASLPDLLAFARQRLG